MVYVHSDQYLLHIFTYNESLQAKFMMKPDKILAPIVLFTYNRPQHTQETISALQKNHYAADSTLYVYSDGPKSESDLVNIQKVRQIIAGTTGFMELKIIERDINYGLARSITEGVTEILDIHGKIIVLEDDLVTSPYFLKYMNEALELYEHEDKVASIHGYSYPVKQPLPDTFFIRGADCWGWATWKRAWNTYERNSKKLLQHIQDNKLNKDFNFNNSYRYTKMLEYQTKGKIDSWAITWYASCFISGMYTLYPYPSLIKNIGFDNSGIHTSKSNLWGNSVRTNPISIVPSLIEENAEARKAFEMFFRKINNPANILKRVINKIFFR